MAILTNVLTAGRSPGKAVRRPYGWIVRAAGTVRARVDWHPDAFLCHLEPTDDRDVVQLAVGRVASRRCDALFSPEHDEALVFEGDGLELRPVGRSGYTVRCKGPLRVRRERDVMRVGRKLTWYRPMDRTRFRRAPAGWCSWYYYYLKVTQKDILRNTDWLARELKPYGLDWVQVDDGWQGEGRGLGENRDWFTVCKRDFPRGMKWLAEAIRKRGLRPGIWCIPLAQSDPERFARSPEMFVRRADGRSPGERDTPLDLPGVPLKSRRVEWMGRYTLDPTAPTARRELTRLFRMLCDEWGYDYVKIDAQGVMADFYRQHRERLADGSTAGDEVYRMALKAMREVMGPRRFLLNCGCGWDSAGLCDGIRTGEDVVTKWDGMAPAIDSTMKWLFLNTIAWYTDPDVVCVRRPLTLEQARVWVTLLGITGQLLMASDNMPALPKERVELLKRVLPVGDIRPMDLYPIDGRASVFDVRVSKPGVGAWDVVACFNWQSRGAKSVTLTPERLGLAPHEPGWVWFDVWRQRVLGVGSDRLVLKLPAMSCRVVCVRPVADHPQVVGTSRHLLQGADDLRQVRWDARSGTLSGRCDVVGGDPYVLHIRVPSGWEPREELRMAGRVAKLTLRTRVANQVSWRLRFRRARK